MLARVLIFTSMSLFIVALGLWMIRNLANAPADPDARLEIATESFACEDGRTIDATFYAARRPPAGVPGRPPSPGGSVRLVLSDGRTFDLPQTVSADGARYAEADESIAFWNTGNGASLFEDGRPTFRDCIAADR